MVDVPTHKRAKRGRKALEGRWRQVLRHEPPEGERVCPHDGAVLCEVAVEV